MASEPQIKLEIERTVTAYPLWKIGATNEPARCRIEHGSPRIWYQWNADTVAAARNIETYFIAKGMKGTSNGPGRTDNVYIFL